MIDPTTLLAGGSAIGLLLYLLRRPKQKPKPEPQNEPQESPQQQDSQNGSSQAWPKPKLAVYDEEANQVGVFDNMPSAKKQWRKTKLFNGSIWDMDLVSEVTPELSLWDRFIRWIRQALFRQSSRRCIPALMPIGSEDEQPQVSQETIDQFLQSLGFDRSASPGNRRYDVELIVKLSEKISKMKLPVYQISKKRKRKPKELVQIKQRREKVRQITITVPEEKQKIETQSRPVDSKFPDNDMDVRQIRSMSELGRLANRATLALPPDILAQRLADHELFVRQYKGEEKSEVVKTEASTRKVIVDEPYLEEYIELREEGDSPEDQLLYILRDVSGSMSGFNTHVAAALAIAVVKRNLQNNARYYYQLFSEKTNTVAEGFTPVQKMGLINSALYGDGFGGGGTNIYSALSVAASKIRATANPDDQPEILLITDGQDSITAAQLHQLLGNKIILHTVVVNRTNRDLKAHSSTYTELWGSDLNSIRRH